MAKRGPAPKPAAKRQGHRKRPSDPKGGALVKLPDATPAPQPLEDWLPTTLQAWGNYWASDVARASETVDVPLILRLFTYYDEWERAMTAYRSQRMMTGSTGQPKISPYFEAAQKLEGMIARLEAELGVSPLARQKLGIAAAQAQLSVAELNKLAEPSDGNTHEAQIIDVDLESFGR